MLTAFFKWLVRVIMFVVYIYYIFSEFVIVCLRHSPLVLGYNGFGLYCVGVVTVHIGLHSCFD